jgi:hypothetical protein
MNQTTGPIRHPQRASPFTTPRIAAIIAAVSLTLLALGWGNSVTARASTTPPSALAFARCMRSHGVHNWPDPERNGQFDKTKTTLQRLGVLQSQLQTAQRACQHLYPNSGQSPQSQDQQLMNAMFNYARCLRAHGVPHWPDPLAESDPGQPNTPGFPRNMPNINQNAPQVKHAMKNCQHLMASIGYGSHGYP